jgi:MarR family transcriptional repressor of emrRAB
VFYLRDLPDDQTLQEFAQRYSEMDPSAVKAAIMLCRTGSDLLTGFEILLSKYGLSQGRFLTLMVLNRTPDQAVSPSQLAERVGVTRATMTGLLDGLHGDEFISREAHAEDRRRLSVRLTIRGRHMLESILPDYYRRSARLMKALTEGERKQLGFLLEKVNQGMSALIGQ